MNYKLHCMLLVSYIQQYFNTSITVLTNRVWKLLIALFKVPNTGAFMVLPTPRECCGYHVATYHILFIIRPCIDLHKICLFPSLEVIVTGVFTWTRSCSERRFKTWFRAFSWFESLIFSPCKQKAVFKSGFWNTRFENAKQGAFLDRDPPRKPDSSPCKTQKLFRNVIRVCAF